MSTPGISILDGKYMATMDLFPQQSKEFNQVHPFFTYLREGRFTTTRCVDCGAEPFPPRIMCPECYSTNMEWIDWPTVGTVIDVTEEVVGVPLGFGKPPLVHALVDLDGKKTFFVRIINCKEGELKSGDKVKLAVFDVDPVPQEVGRDVVEIPRVFYAFEPVK
ncbi:MAG TPA: zinc ribbon domain-containing protein [Desulfomonilaceae bacterium]|nr:zinc ribbon domain-containing protein [Desulfomonilaceae bacterium]